MNWTDGVIVAILVLSILIGLMRGLIAELLSLVVWIAAFWVASVYGPTVGELLRNVISLPVARMSLGYGICFFGILLLGALVRFATRRLLWSTGLTGIDRLLGVVFGFLRGVLVVTLMVFLVGLTGLTRDSWWQQSVLLPQFQGTAAWLGQNIPARVADHLHPQKVIDTLQSAPVLQRQPAGNASSRPAAKALHGIDPSAITRRMGDLLNGLGDSTSSVRPAAPASRPTNAPAAASSAPSQLQPL
ncbi:MAG: CvpA family protein [Pseudomonadota bacterium]|nr:CvpA family protein [Pseudomonadota bacterium]